MLRVYLNARAAEVKIGIFEGLFRKYIYVCLYARRGRTNFVRVYRDSLCGGVASSDASYFGRAPRVLYRNLRRESLMNSGVPAFAFKDE